MRLSRFVRKLVLAAVAVLVLSACSTAPSGGMAAPVPEGTYPRIAMLGGLEHGVVFGQTVVTAATPTRPMSVVQAVRDIEDYPIDVQYRYKFYDAMRRPVATSEGWRFMTLPPQVDVHFEGAALDDNAVDWRLQVRPAE